MWEYKTEIGSGDKNEIDFLNHMGKCGWELVSVFLKKYHTTLTYYFKRRWTS